VRQRNIHGYAHRVAELFSAPGLDYSVRKYSKTCINYALFYSEEQD